MELDTLKLFLLASFVMFIPFSAICYFFSRSGQRILELRRYMDILNIENKNLFEQKYQGVSFFIAVFFVTLLATGYWYLMLFGADKGIANNANFLFSNIKIAEPNAAENELIVGYQNGAILTFNMAFLGAYLWGIQNIVRRYSMNDLIPVAYFNLGVRMIFASLLALMIYHLSEVAPQIFVSMLVSTDTGMSSETTKSNGTDLIMPIFAFLIGMFPQRGLKWLTEKFSIFSQKNDPSVRDLPLEMVEGISIYDRVRLQELGIDSCYDLANVDYIPCLFKMPYSPRILISWILQAKLCVYFGRQVKDLREHGIHTVWQLNSYKPDELKELVKSTSLTEDTLLRVKTLITKDHEIERLIAAQFTLSQYWDLTNDEGRNKESQVR